MRRGTGGGVEGGRLSAIEDELNIQKGASPPQQRDTTIKTKFQIIIIVHRLLIAYQFN